MTQLVNYVLTIELCIPNLKENPHKNVLVASFAIIFSHSEGSFHLAYSFLCCAKAFKFH